MSEKRDYYEVLGVSKSATEAELKKSFRRMAMKHHPDRNPGDKNAEHTFKEVKEAYETLSDSRKRAAYDQFGHAGVNQQFGGGAGAGGFGFGDIGDAFGDIFGDIFGGGRRGSGGRQQRAQRGADLMYEMQLSLEEAVHGVEKEVDVASLAPCARCDGSGAKKGSGPVSCQTCRGSGQVHMQHGFLAVQQPCPECRGAGSIIKDPCSDCHGQGRVKENRTLSVKIPAGIDTGDRIRLTGKGEAGQHGAPQGDLYVQVHIMEHNLFQREGNDLHIDVPVDYVTAALGGEIKVPTLDGQVKLTIPEGTQSDKLFRLRSKGVKALRSSAIGDLLCNIIIETPIRLSAEQKELLQKFGDSIAKDAKDHSPRSKGWFDAVKDFFAHKS